MKCNVCKSSYDDGKSKCPKCAAPNPLLKPETYITIEVEMPSALYRGIQRECSGTMKPEEFVIVAIENYISSLTRQRV